MRVNYSSNELMSVNEVISKFFQAPTSFITMDKNEIPFDELKSATIRLSKNVKYYGIILYYEMFLRLCGTDTIAHMELYLKHAILFMYALNKVYKGTSYLKGDDVKYFKDVYLTYLRKLKHERKNFGEHIGSEISKYTIEPAISGYFPIDVNDKRRINTFSMSILFLFNIRDFFLIDKNRLDWKMIEEFIRMYGNKIPNIVTFYTGFVKICQATSRDISTGRLNEDFRDAIEFMRSFSLAVVQISKRRVNSICNSLIKRMGKIITRKGLRVGAPYKGSAGAPRIDILDEKYGNVKKITNIRTLLLYFYLKPNAFIKYDKNTIPMRKLLDEIEYHFNEDEIYLFDMFLKFCSAKSTKTMKRFIEPVKEFFEKIMSRIYWDSKDVNLKKRIFNKQQTIDKDYYNIIGKIKTNSIGMPLKKM